MTPAHGLASAGAAGRAQALAEQVMQDMDLAFEMDRARAPTSRAPSRTCRGATRPWARARTPMPMSATVDALERLHDYEELDRSMRGRLRGRRARRRRRGCAPPHAGRSAVQDLRRLKQIERALEKAGLVQRRRGRLEVTPRGARKLGERALTQIFDELKRDREGTHEARDPGGLAEPTGRHAAVDVRRPRADRRAARRCSTRWSRAGTRPAGPPATRRLRARGGRTAHRGRHRAPAGPVVLDAAARALVHAEEDGAGAARADRGPVSARHAVPDRVQRLRAPAAARGPHGAAGSSASTARTCNTRSCWPGACCRNIRGRRAR